MADPEKPSTRDTVLGTVDAFVRSTANFVTFGYADKWAAEAATKTGIGGEKGNLDANLAREAATTAEDERVNPNAVMGGKVMGAALGAAEAKLAVGVARNAGPLAAHAGSAIVNGTRNVAAAAAQLPGRVAATVTNAIKSPIRTAAVVAAAEAADRGIDLTVGQIAKATVRVAADGAAEKTKDVVVAGARLAPEGVGTVIASAPVVVATGVATINADKLTGDDREQIAAAGADAAILQAKFEREAQTQASTYGAVAAGTTWAVAKGAGAVLSKFTGPVGKIVYRVAQGAEKTGMFGALALGTVAASEGAADVATAATEAADVSAGTAEATAGAAVAVTAATAAAIPKVRSATMHKVGEWATKFKGAGPVGKVVALGGAALLTMNYVVPAMDLSEGVETRLAEDKELAKVRDYRQQMAALANSVDTAVAAEAPAAAAPATTAPAATSVEAAHQVAAAPHAAERKHASKPATRPPEEFNPIAQRQEFTQNGVGFQLPQAQLGAELGAGNVFDGFGQPLPVHVIAATHSPAEAPASEAPAPVPPAAVVVSGTPSEVATPAEGESIQLGKLKESLQAEPQTVAINTVTQRPNAPNIG